MLKSQLQLLLISLAACALLGLYSLSSNRHHRTAEKIRLEREYLSWDWKDTPEEVACQSVLNKDTEHPIPAVVHFILIAKKGEQADLQFYQYLAIKAALLRIQPDAVKLHSYDLNEDSTWWKLIKHRVNLVLHAPRETLKTADNVVHQLRLPHQTDVLRLEILHEEGGIYLDTDVYALQSFAPLLQSPKDLLMGHEGGNRSGIGNAVIVSRPASAFISKWLAEYRRSFDDRPQMWNHHSIKLPAELAMRHPEDICKLSPSAFFWPTWSAEHIESMHQPILGKAVTELQSNMSQFNGAMYANQFAYHAWGNLARASHLDQLSPGILLDVDSTFNILLRDVHQAEV